VSKKEITYKDSGVDIEAGETLVQNIKEVVKETHTPSVLSNIGGFGALFKPDLSDYKKPVLVSSVDGVGTKLIVAFKAGKYDTIGQDLVNHCVNDIAVCGATPLFFMDYFSTGKLNQQIAFDVIKGFSIACKENGVALIGGETAEMPDIYKEGEFDLAGTIVGIADQDKLINGNNIHRDNLIIGFKSNGLHTNGFSLARKVLFSEYKPDDYIDSLNMSLSESLLQIHKSYFNIISKLKDIEGVNGFSHITGGGIIGNTQRILPEGMNIKIDWGSWNRPEIFKLIQKTGNVPEKDMRKTFNLGIGLAAVIHKNSLNEVTEILKNLNEEFFTIGTIA
jgi:phosphoribosylformylglycinamidine cyclo-ligase